MNIEADMADSRAQILVGTGLIYAAFVSVNATGGYHQLSPELTCLLDSPVLMATVGLVARVNAAGRLACSRSRIL